MYQFFSLLYGLFISPFVSPELSLRSASSASEADDERAGNIDPNG